MFLSCPFLNFLQLSYVLLSFITACMISSNSSYYRDLVMRFGDDILMRYSPMRVAKPKKAFDVFLPIL